MRRLALVILCLVAFCVTEARAAEVIDRYLPGAEPVGTARMRVLGMNIYDATLFARGGVWREEDPVALELYYLRNLKGGKIADRSAEEMRRTGVTDEVRLAAWHAQMRSIFPDVREGMTLTGILMRNGETVFLHDGKEIGRIKDKTFGQSFFGIWLSERTSEPRLRQKLLGAP